MTFEEFKKEFQKKEIVEISYSPPQQPLVSVLVQTYRQKQYIRESLEGILNQETNFGYEILLGEDGSIDGTREICLEFAEKYPGKIRLFLHKRENQIRVIGEATSNFNALYNFYSSQGRYIAFCEGDDVWNDKYYLQKSIDFLEKNTEFVLTYHKYEVINSHGEKINTLVENLQAVHDMNELELSKVKYHPLLLCTCFRNVINEIPHEMVHVINLDTFIFSLLGNYGKAKFISMIHPSFYRNHTGGIWSKRDKEKKILSKIITYKNLASYYLKIGNTLLADHYRDLQLNHYKMLFIQRLKTRQVWNSLKTMTQYLNNKLNLKS